MSPHIKNALQVWQRNHNCSGIQFTLLLTKVEIIGKFSVDPKVLNIEFQRIYSNFHIGQRDIRGYIKI